MYIYMYRFLYIYMYIYTHFFLRSVATSSRANYSKNAYRWCAILQLLFGCHTASAPITSGTHTGGVQ